MTKYIFIVCLFVQAVASGQNIITITGDGNGPSNGDNGPATAAQVTDPAGGEFDKYGNYYFVDADVVHKVRKIDTAGVITTVAGNGSGTYAGDNGPATAASLYDPQAVRIDSAGNMYIADLQNERIRKVNTAGIITTIVGNGTGSYNGDNIAATAATIWGPQDICLDKFGNLYIADAFNYRVRKVDHNTGIITTIAGNGTPGYSGENTLADTSMVGLIVGLCSDTSGNIYLASNTINRLIKVSTSGIMTTVAGNGVYTYTGDSVPATAANISPGKVYVDKEGDIFISDKYNNRIYKVTTDGILHNIAGDGTAGDTGDNGPATAASLNGPVGIALDPCGNAYIPDIGNGTSGTGKRIRKIIFDSTCGSNGDTTHTDTTNAVQNIKGGSFSVYPNPATTEIVVTGNSINGVQVINIVGQVVYDKAFVQQKKITIDISALPNGVYFVKVNPASGGIYVQKVVKE